MKIEGANAIVTGGASGLGEATARMLKTQGANVAIIDQNADRGQALARSLNAMFLQADVTDEAQINDALQSAEDRYGIASILANCAGIAPNIPTFGYKGPHPMDAFRRTLEINVVGTFLSASRFARRLLDLEPTGGERGIVIDMTP